MILSMKACTYYKQGGRLPHRGNRPSAEAPSRSHEHYKDAKNFRFFPIAFAGKTTIQI
jgi:hypothetical protein